MENVIYHHGILGMKWGVRRYQNKDGTLTKAGKKRMYREQFDMENKDPKERQNYKIDPNRWVKEDIERAKRLTDASSTMVSQLKNTNDRAIKKRSRISMDLSNMSDKEMRDKINRAYLEQQYADMFNPQTVSRGRKYAGKILETTGTALTIAGTSLSIALAMKQLLG